MEKTKTFFEEISDFLGPKENRYFASGYKSINILYRDMIYHSGILSTSISVQLGENWSRKKGQNLKPHLGTTEFISIAAVMAQQLMEKELYLNHEDIKISWISRLAFKIKKCEYADYYSIPVSGKIISTTRAGDHFTTRFNIRIGSLIVLLDVCHPPKSSIKHIPTDHMIDLYQKGYKLRDHTITDVSLDEEDMTSSGHISLYDCCGEKKGIGARYSGIILTDFILIIGQLIQAFLYNMNHVNRENSNNLWLREVDAYCETPSTGMSYSSQVKFVNINIIQKSDETWQSVAVMSNIGNITSEIKVAQKIH